MCGFKAEHRRNPRDFYPLHLTDSNPVGPDDESLGKFIKVFYSHRNMILLSNPNRRIAAFSAFPYIQILLPVWRQLQGIKMHVTFEQKKLGYIFTPKNVLLVYFLRK